MSERMPDRLRESLVAEAKSVVEAKQEREEFVAKITARAVQIGRKFKLLPLEYELLPMLERTPGPEGGKNPSCPPADRP